MNIERFEQLKTKIDEIRRKHDRAEGALSNLMVRLESEHGCKTVKDAKIKLEQLKVKVRKAEKKYDDSLAAFEEEWSDQLEVV